MKVERQEAIENLKSLRVWTTRDDTEQALDIAIDTMRKYQKIERIFKDWCEVGDDGDICAFRNLKQVICPCIGDKDGNDD